MSVAVVIADRNDDNMAGFTMVCESLLSARLLEMTVFMATKTIKLTSDLLECSLLTMRSSSEHVCI